MDYDATLCIVVYVANIGESKPMSSYWPRRRDGDVLLWVVNVDRTQVPTQLRLAVGTCQWRSRCLCRWDYGDGISDLVSPCHLNPSCRPAISVSRPYGHGVPIPAPRDVQRERRRNAHEDQARKYRPIARLTPDKKATTEEPIDINEEKSYRP